jgi:RES domain-containing protein
MRRNRRPRPPEARRPLRSGEPDLPSLVELERFTQASLRQWLATKGNLDGLQRALYFELEPLRQRNEARLLDALRSQTLPSLPFEGWSRILDYRYCLQPLSVAGSLKGEGGRFNIGAELSPGTFTPFPALYIAEDYEAAFRERFGAPPTSGPDGLSIQELALRSPGSFTQVRLRGTVETVIDVGNLETLKLFAGVLREFPIPKDVRRLARTLGFSPPPWLVRSPTTLQRQLLHSNWRMLPQQFDLPSNSQIFGRIALAAGVNGILYPSARQVAKRCLALFPQNWAGSNSFIEVTDEAPQGARLTRIDATTREFL